MYAVETARLSVELMDNAKPGIYHVVGNDLISKYEFGKLISIEMGLSPDIIIPSTIAEWDGRKLRAKNLHLSNKKMLSYGLVTDTVQIGIRKLLRVELNEK
jgi:dTDP-4-dehydrorhamnose reductase